MTRLTAIIIKTNVVRCEAGGPTDEGNFVGWIMKDVKRWEPLIQTEAIYDSKEEAIAAMKDIVADVRELDLSLPV